MAVVEVMEVCPLIEFKKSWMIRPHHILKSSEHCIIPIEHFTLSEKNLETTVSVNWRYIGGFNLTELIAGLAVQPSAAPIIKPWTEMARDKNLLDKRIPFSFISAYFYI